MLTNNTENLPAGTLVTICIGADEYAGRVVRSTRRSCVVERLYGGRQGKLETFRLSAGASYYNFRTHLYLTVGEARQQIDQAY